jgi:hypothetical protein
MTTTMMMTTWIKQMMMIEISDSADFSDDDEDEDED